jgi:hypothetical protein
MKTIPKSLHTVTVLVAVARIYMTQGMDYNAATAAAERALGYGNSPDTYALADKARAILDKSVQS